ncbi:hypothetical protein [Polaribacter septentrionalilitoris]|uniref:hypothetical protein n=1 Tax=Polaribacter septentrionalilitoris TaxID=2494657 RepID=UPI00135A5D33|nr:hypothetical protein [Polaribacter septentrionalilitoris]
MKKIKLKICLLALFFLPSFLIFSQVGIGTENPNTSSMLDIQSTSKGILIPRMTTVQRNTITGVEGLLVFDSTTKTFWYYNNIWVELTAGSSASNKITDTDNDTKIEIIGDEDKLRISAADTLRVTVDNVGVTELGTPGTNYTKITSDGSLSYVGEATRWEDLQVPVSSVNIKKVASEPKWDDFIGSISLLWFEEGEELQSVSFTVQMPHKWKEGSTIKPHIHWTSGRSGDAAPGTNRVKWALEYVWANVAGEFNSTSTTLTGSVVATPNEGSIPLREHIITPLGDITATGKTLSSMILCRLYRVNDGDDSYSGDAGLLEIDFHYQVDSDGSNDEYTKKD